MGNVAFHEILRASVSTLYKKLTKARLDGRKCVSLLFHSEQQSDVCVTEL